MIVSRDVWVVSAKTLRVGLGLVCVTSAWVWRSFWKEFTVELGGTLVQDPPAVALFCFEITVKFVKIQCLKSNV